eukprot:974088-Rhodomonas_salina.1
MVRPDPPLTPPPPPVSPRTDQDHDPRFWRIQMPRKWTPFLAYAYGAVVHARISAATWTNLRCHEDTRLASRLLQQDERIASRDVAGYAHSPRGMRGRIYAEMPPS